MPPTGINEAWEYKKKEYGEFVMEQEGHSWDIYQKGASAAKLVEIPALVVYLTSLALT